MTRARHKRRKLDWTKKTNKQTKKQKQKKPQQTSNTRKIPKKRNARKTKPTRMQLKKRIIISHAKTSHLNLTINYFVRRQWQPTPVLLPGKSHGQRSLVGSSPWGHEESDTTERLPFHFSLSCIGKENGNPLQCSCLENPRDGGNPSGLPSMGSHRVGHD